MGITRFYKNCVFNIKAGNSIKDRFSLILNSILNTINVRLPIFAPRLSEIKPLKIFAFEIDVPFYLQYMDMPIFYEIWTDEAYAFETPLKKDGWIVDIGANIGLSARYFTNAYKNTFSILAIEPDPRNYRLLEKNIANFKNIHPRNCAVSDHEGLLGFKSNAFNSKISSKKPDFYIQSYTLDTILSPKPYSTYFSVKNRY